MKRTIGVPGTATLVRGIEGQGMMEICADGHVRSAANAVVVVDSVGGVSGKMVTCFRTKGYVSTGFGGLRGVQTARAKFVNSA